MNFVTFESRRIYPSKIVCVGRNYAEHIAELNNAIPDEPVLFVKPNSAIAEALYANDVSPVHYEGEIVCLVEQAAIVALAFGFDLTKRDLQTGLKSRGLPWERAKAFDRSAVFSRFVELTVPLSSVRMELWLNDGLVQSGGYEAMLFKPGYLLEDINRFMTLADGDLLMTGTPKGVGPLIRDDRFLGKLFSNDRLLLEQQWIVQ
ncbi:fumarylacetoacetate hydrolase family protein [Methylicorpusculum oleiharenae]|uniref:fumarylacetoacetate hydrolase family protein n=1 Tax=Methylicorpusculum oleiharenae TaxID=1338687 RepID=UPI0013581FFE|nr:fumarylacetoacetate hydrolase family protein [Methylicorpusculum oleiharenae]MCD2452355.1 fumarylacetoacetate hydrolase family protein [Methylicorpusculum oleiharenae]